MLPFPGRANLHCYQTAIASGQAQIAQMIQRLRLSRTNYATARRREEPISTAVTESTVQWLVHRRMNAQQQMRWTPRGAHLIAQGSMRGNERFPPARSRRRRRARPPSFSSRGITPKV